MINTFISDGLEFISLSNEFIELVALPQIGGKVISIKDKKSNTEFLLPNQNPTGKYLIPNYGDDFSKYDTSGFDDCFPNISEEKILIKQNQISLPDHGELWSRPWNYSTNNDEINFSIQGIQFNYLFEKKIALNERKIIIDYQLTNLSLTKFSYIWSAHPLLQIEEGDEIILPKEINNMKIFWSSYPKFKGKLTFPIFNNIDFLKVQSPKSAFALKLFSEKFKSGYAGLYKKDKKVSILFEFDAIKIPFLGLWLCYGGWPIDQTKKHYTIAIEPTTSNNDSLRQAIKNKSAKVILPNKKIRWTIIIKISNVSQMFD